ncbi:MAG: CHAD domain-containing protein [Acidimicrobiales bacterium]
MGDTVDAGTDPVEVEWQFDALDLRPVERWLAALPERAVELPPLPMFTVRTKPPRRLVDRYVDTEDWRIGRAGLVLRTRRQGRREEATLKDTRPADESGLRRRLEVTEELPPAGLGALAATGPVGWRVAAVAGSRPLRQVIEVRTRRQPFAVRSDGREVAEVVLDQTVLMIGAGQPPAHLRRVEVEVDAEWADTLRPLVEELRDAAGLTPATRSKFEAGLLAAGLDVPGPPDLGPTAAGRDSTLGELAFAMLRTYLAALLAHEPGTRLGEDPEELHAMRVATRRLRAALDLFADAYPARAAGLRPELKWVAGALGAVRDLDVQLDHTADMGTRGGAGNDGDDGGGGGGGGESDVLADLRSLLVDERVAARRELLAALDSARWEQARSSLVALATHGPNRRVPAVRLPAAQVVGAMVADRHRKAVRALRRARRTRAGPDFHRLRIRCKRLRYSLELTAAVYGRPAQRFAEKLAALQDALGLVQDDEAAQSRLQALATGTGRPGGAGHTLSPATVFALGGLAERYRRDAEQRTGAMAKQLGKLTGGAWDTLVAEIERRAAIARAALPPRTVRMVRTVTSPPDDTAATESDPLPALSSSASRRTEPSAAPARPLRSVSRRRP